MSTITLTTSHASHASSSLTTALSVDAITPAEREVLSLTHATKSLNTLAMALTPFVPLYGFIKHGFAYDSTQSSIVVALAVRVGLVGMIVWPNCVAPATACAIAVVLGFEKKRKSALKSHGSDSTCTESVRLSSTEVTDGIEAVAKTLEKCASAAFWTSRAASAGIVYASIVMSVLMIFCSWTTMCVVVALYVTRPAMLRVVPDPLTSLWSRLPDNSKAATNIQ